MRLRYNVLCVDDEINSLDQQKANFETVNAEVGIEICYQDIAVRPGAREDETAFKERIKSELAQKFNERTFDLILVDLHMKGGINGPDVVEWIRDSHSIYRPIIFYSAGIPATDDNAVQQLSDEAKKAEILGKNLMITPRSKLSALLETIAKEMHQEEHKVNQVRGLLMDQVSEIDSKLMAAIDTLWPKVSTDKQQGIIDAALKRVNKDKDAAIAVAQTLSEKAYVDMLQYFNEDITRWSIYTRAIILRKLLQATGQNAVADEFLNFYNQVAGQFKPLVQLRNEYAHQSSTALSAVQDVAKCKHIRVESRRHLKNLEDFLNGQTS